MIPLDILVLSPSVRLPYKLESDDVASSLFLSTTSTVPNTSFSCIWVSLPCQNCPMYKSNDVAPSFFLSTTTTVPNVSVLFSIVYTGALLSAVCGKVIPCICPICQNFHIYINYKVITNQLQQSAIIYNQLQSFNSRVTIVLHNYIFLQPFTIQLQSFTFHLQSISNHLQSIYNHLQSNYNQLQTIGNPFTIQLHSFTMHRQSTMNYNQLQPN